MGRRNPGQGLIRLLELEVAPYRKYRLIRAWEGYRDFPEKRGHVLQGPVNKIPLSFPGGRVWVGVTHTGPREPASRGGDVR